MQMPMYMSCVYVGGHTQKGTCKTPPDSKIECAYMVNINNRTISYMLRNKGNITTCNKYVKKCVCMLVYMHVRVYAHMFVCT